MSVAKIPEKALLWSFYAAMFVATMGGFAFYIGGNILSWFGALIFSSILVLGQMIALDMVAGPPKGRRVLRIAWALVAIALMMTSTLFAYNGVGRLLDRGDVSVERLHATQTRVGLALSGALSNVTNAQAALHDLVATAERIRGAERESGGVCLGNENARGRGRLARTLAERAETYASIASYVDRGAGELQSQVQLTAGHSNNQRNAAVVYNRMFVGQFAREGALLLADARRFEGAEAFVEPDAPPLRCFSPTMAHAARRAGGALSTLEPINLNGIAAAQMAAPDARVRRLVSTLGGGADERGERMSFNDVFAVMVAAIAQLVVLLLTLGRSVNDGSSTPASPVKVGAHTKATIRPDKSK